MHGGHEAGQRAEHPLATVLRDRHARWQGGHGSAGGEPGPHRLRQRRPVEGAVAEDDGPGRRRGVGDRIGRRVDAQRECRDEPCGHGLGVLVLEQAEELLAERRTKSRVARQGRLSLDHDLQGGLVRLEVHRPGAGSGADRAGQVTAESRSLSGDPYVDGRPGVLALVLAEGPLPVQQPQGVAERGSQRRGEVRGGRVWLEPRPRGQRGEDDDQVGGKESIGDLEAHSDHPFPMTFACWIASTRVFRSFPKSTEGRSRVKLSGR